MTPAPLRIGHLSTLYHTAPLLIAWHERVRSALGANPTWRLYGTGPAIVADMARGLLDIAYIGLPPAIIGIANGAPIVCIAGGHVEGTVIVGDSKAKAYPQAQTLHDVLKQFEGSTIGVPGKGSIHDIILGDSLSMARLEGRIEVRRFPWADAIVEAMAKGQVRGAFGTPALAVACNRFAGGGLIYPPHLLWPSNPSYGIVVTKASLADRRSEVEAFVALHEEAEEFLRTSPKEAAGLIANVLGVVDEAYVLETLGISPRYCAQLSDGFISSSMKFVRRMKELGYIERCPTEQEIFDLCVISKIHPSGDHYNYGGNADG